MDIDEIRKILSEVKHPEINNSLIELGMIGNIEEKGKLFVELKLPMLGVPIRDLLVSLIKDALKDFEVEVTFSEMNEQEKTRFFELARQNWAV